MELLIKWDIDHDCSYNKFFLSGDYNGNRFTRIVSDKLWGIPLIYAKWCIGLRHKILNKK